MPDKPDINGHLIKLVDLAGRTHEATEFIKEDIKEVKADVKTIKSDVAKVSKRVVVLETEVDNLKTHKCNSKPNRPKWVQRVKDNYLYGLGVAVVAGVVKLVQAFLGGE